MENERRVIDFNAAKWNLRSRKTEGVTAGPNGIEGLELGQLKHNRPSAIDMASVEANDHDECQ